MESDQEGMALDYTGTKERILYEALNLFSMKGYDAVSVREIARAVGIKESSLYNHFAGKQELFDTIIKHYTERGDNLFVQEGVTVENREFEVDEKTVDLYRNMTPEQFAHMSSRIFEFYFSDDINVKLRKMLTIEQYRNPDIAKVFRQISFQSSIEYQRVLFQALMDSGNFREMDSELLAMEFFAPIFLIFYMFDNTPENLPAAKELFLKHVNHFNELYKKER